MSISVRHSPIHVVITLPPPTRPWAEVAPLARHHLRALESRDGLLCGPPCYDTRSEPVDQGHREDDACTRFLMRDVAVVKVAVTIAVPAIERAKHLHEHFCAGGVVVLPKWKSPVTISTHPHNNGARVASRLSGSTTGMAADSTARTASA